MPIKKYRGVSYQTKSTSIEMLIQTRFLFSEGEDTVKFKAGDIIFKKGNKGDSMYSIVEGEVDIIIEDEIIETLTNKDIFGEMALVDQKPRSATVRAKTDCKINVISKKRFLYFVQKNPYFALDIMSILSNRLRKMNDLFDQLSLEGFFDNK